MGHASRRKAAAGRGALALYLTVLYFASIVSPEP